MTSTLEDRQGRWIDVGVLAAGLAHDISNPLAAVIANLDLALRDAEVPLGDELPDVLADAREGAERIREIVSDLRVFGYARDREGTPSDLHATMLAALRLASRETNQRACVTTVLQHVEPVAVRQSHLAHALLNLVVDGCRAVPEAAGNFSLCVTAAMASPAKACVSIELDVTNVVWSDEVVSRCRATLVPVGATLSIEADDARASLARLLLPVAITPPAQPSELPPAPSTVRRRILVIDDDPAVATVVRRILAADYDVTVVFGASDALQSLATGERFDLILCDLMMPVMTGMDFHAELERTDPTLASRVVFVTGGVFTERARDYLAIVANPRIEKPFDGQALRAIVARSLRPR